MWNHIKECDVQRHGHIGILILLVWLIALPGHAQPDWHNEIIQAIKDHKIITFTYNDEYRVIEPHSYGRNKNTGNNLLSAYQIEGGSVSGSPIPGWRMFNLTKIRNLIVTDKTFPHAREGYSPDDRRMHIIFEKL